MNYDKPKNRKIIYLSIFLVLALFMISACEQYNTAIIDKNDEAREILPDQDDKKFKEQNCLPINTKSNLKPWLCTKFYTEQECKKFDDVIRNTELKELVQNFNNKNDLSRINLIFLGYEYSNLDKIKNFILETIGIDENGKIKNNGFFKVEPINNYVNSFNLYYTFIQDKNLADGVVYNLKNKFDNRYVVFIELFNQPFGSQIFGKSVVANPNEGRILMDLPEDWDFENQQPVDETGNKALFSLILAHEFSHVFAFLSDEYISESVFYEPNTGLDLGPNCDLANSDIACTKWCKEKPKPVEALKAIICDVDPIQDVPTICRNKINSGLPCACANCETKIGFEPSELPQTCINVISYCTSQQTKSDCENGLYRDICKWNGGSDANNFQPILDPYYQSYCIPINSEVNIGSNCLEGSGCYQGCKYINAYRSSKNSIMRNSGESKGDNFNQYSKDLIIKCFDNLKN